MSVMTFELPSTLTRGVVKHAQVRDFFSQSRVSPDGQTASCVDDPIKVDALMFFLDFEIYRQTGQSVTEAQYVVGDSPWPVTPLPRQLYRADVALPYCKYNRGTFSKREWRLLHHLGQTFSGVAGADMPDAAYVIRDPWAQVCLAALPHGAPVPYTLVLDDRPDSVSAELAAERAEEAEWVRHLARM